MVHEQAKERRFVRCQILDKPNLGEIHIHARPWTPNRVLEVVYYAPGGGRWLVPEETWDDFLASTSHIEAMAVIRSAHSR